MSSARSRLLQELAARFGLESAPGAVDDTIEVELRPTLLPETAAVVLELPATLIAIWASEEPEGPRAHYLLGADDEDLLIILRVILDGDDRQLPSLTAEHTAADAAERELMQRFGLQLLGHPLGDAQGRPIPGGTVVEGRGLTRLTIGPIRGPLEESLTLELDTVGDRIVHAEPRFGAKHRAAEQRPFGLKPAQAVSVAERLCGACSVANATAMSLALERITDHDVPRRAVWLRTALLEMERIAGHASSLANLSAAALWQTGATRALRLRETLLEAYGDATGSRSLRSLVTAGGLLHDLGEPRRLAEVVARAATSLRGVAHDALDLPPLIEQLEGRAVVSTEVAQDLALSGPTARAAGVRRDARQAYPYLAYGEVTFWAPVYWTGDALARLRVWQDELEQAAALVEELLGHLPEGPVFRPLEPLQANARSVAVVEAPAGITVHAVHTDDAGSIARWHVRSASQSIWPALRLGLLGQDVRELPVLERSFGLCVACAER